MHTETKFYKWLTGRESGEDRFEIWGVKSDGQERLLYKSYIGDDDEFAVWHKPSDFNVDTLDAFKRLKPENFTELTKKEVFLYAL